MAGPGDAKGRRKNRSSAVATSPDQAGAGDGGATNPKPSHGQARSKPSAGAPPGIPVSGLCIVATPIGHSRDVTLRALDVLGAVDVIACEDTRVTAKLLALHGISRPLTPYHEHNAEKAGPRLIKRLKNGGTVALVSDAGTPLVSDPGYKLVRACLDLGLPVTPIPGPSAVLTALIASGLPTDRFFFAGFLPTKAAQRRRALADVAAVPATLVFMESAKRLAASLADMAAALGNRDAAVTRELTKMFEQVRRAPLDALARHYQDSGPPKGEVTVVVGPPVAAEIDDAELDRRLTEVLPEMSVRDAAQKVAAETGVPRKRVYARALDLKKHGR